MVQILAADPTWTQGDSDVLAASDQKADRDAAVLRMAVSGIISVTLLIIVAVSSLWTSWITFVALVNLLPAALALRLVRSDRYRAWSPWLMATADTVFLFGIARFGPSFGALLPGSRAALVSLWGSFLIIALMAYRPRASTILFQTALLALNFALIVWLPAHPSLNAAAAPEFGRLFSDGANIVRFTMIVLTGTVLALGANRSRQALKVAIKSARERTALQRFLPQQLDAYLASSDLGALQRGRRLEVGVLFADMRNFTALAEGLDAFRVAEVLRSFRVRAEGVVGRHGGVIDKFIGDGLLVVFGLVEGEEPARVLDAALALSTEIDAWNAKREAGERRRIGVGIGAHIGECFVGAVGGDRRQEFTVIGDAVNVAQRLEEATRAAGAVVVVSGVLLDRRCAPDNPARAGWEELTSLTLRGRQAPVRAFALRPRVGEPAEAREATSSPHSA